MSERRSSARESGAEFLRRSAVEGWSKSSPGVAKWTKHAVARHLMVGGLGATVVGTPVQVADEFEKWVDEGDVDGFNIVGIKSSNLASNMTDN